MSRNQTLIYLPFHSFSSYTCQIGGTCYWMTPNPCGTHFLSDFVVTAGNVLGSEIISFTTTEAKAGGINARSVQVRWQSTDLGILSLLSPTSVLTSTSREPSPAAPITFPTKIPESTTLKLGTSTVSFGLTSHPAAIQSTAASDLVNVPPNSSHHNLASIYFHGLSVDINNYIHIIDWTFTKH